MQRTCDLRDGDEDIAALQKCERGAQASRRSTSESVARIGQVCKLKYVVVRVLNRV
jgi:hypothetical protein